MQALRLLVVFAASASASLWLAHRWIAPISRRAVAVLLLLPALLTWRTFFTGGFYGPLNLAYESAPLAARAGELPESRYENGELSDVAIQMVPWRKAVREAVKNGRAPLINRFSLSGDILLASYQSGVFHPATWIGFLLPLATAWTFAMAFTQFLAGLFAFLYLRDLEVREEAAFFGAAAWTLSNAITGLQGWPLGPIFAAFPLLLLGVRRLARGLPGGFTAAVAAWVLMGLAGHPESMLQSTAAAAVVFAFELFRSGSRLRAIGRSIGAGVLAFGICAAAVLPFLEALPQTMEFVFRSAVVVKADRSLPAQDAVRAGLGFVSPRAFEAVTGDRPAQPATFRLVTKGYVGVITLALAGVGLLSRRRERSSLAAAGLGSLLVAVGFPGIADVVLKLPLFDIAIGEYFVGAAAFCAVALAAIGLEKLEDSDGRLWPALLILVAMAAIGLLWRSALREAGVAPAAYERSVLLSLAPVALFLLAAAVLRKRPRALAAAALVALLASRVAEVPRHYATFPRRFFYPPIDELHALPGGGPPYRTAGLGYALVPNQSSLYELEDPRGYQAMTNLRYFQTYPLWSVHQPVWFNRIDDPSRPFLSFLNVRFLLAEPKTPTPDGWRETARGGSCALFENPAALPRAFAPERIRFVARGSSPVEEMGRGSDFSKLAWIEDPAQPPREVPNGRAAVSVRADGADLELTVRAQAPAWIVVSQTAWKGWKALLGRQPLPVRFANHAFLGFRVPAGTHRVLLRYLPDSFRMGVAVSLLSLGAAGALALRRKFADSGGVL